MFHAVAVLFLLLISVSGYARDSCLFRDLALVEEIDACLNDELPLFYNASFIGGYFAMPSARFPKEGELAFGVSSVYPYWIFGANFAPYNRIELSANYRVFRGVEEGNFGREGFGDDADRIGNVKFGILMPEDGYPSYIPTIAFGLDDFVGTKRFSSQYFVATKTWPSCGLEVSLGWGRGRIKGVFGGVAWTPFHNTCIPVLKNLTAVVEYDANDYKKHQTEHFKGREVDSRFNGGLHLLVADTFQANVFSVRGKEIGASASIRFPLGSTDGIFPKVDDPCCYTSPVDIEPLGRKRPEETFVADLACRFAGQGLDLYDAYLCNNTLTLQIVNNRYRKEACLRTRIQDLLAALTPRNVDTIQVVIEAEGIVSHSYCFRTCDLYRLREGCANEWLIETLSPMAEAPRSFGPYDAAHLFQRRREVWTFTVRPRLINFFGSTTGKYKYSLGLIGAMNGFLPGGLTYNVQTGYSAYSSMHGLTSKDRLNPSRLLHVRTDSVLYYTSSKVRLDEAFLQRSFNLGRGFFFRAAAGYFEPAFAGGALEALYYPVQSNWAVGIDAAVVKKRRYTGFTFFSEVPRFNSANQEVFEKYTGIQAFLDLYYNLKPLRLLFHVKAGQFLAKDKGARFTVTRVFESGARFSLWVTATNADEKVNGRRYFDKGFAFIVPFDIFLKKSSRTLLSYAMSAWLRDQGAVSETGIRLYPTLYEERVD